MVAKTQFAITGADTRYFLNGALLILVREYNALSTAVIVSSLLVASPAVIVNALSLASKSFVSTYLPARIVSAAVMALVLRKGS